MSLWEDFVKFIKEQNVLSVALGLVTGFAAKTLIDALIADLITPLYAPYLDLLNPEMPITIGMSTFKIGHFFESLISFLVVLFVVFIISKKLTKKKK